MNGDEHVEEPDVTAGRRAFLKRMAALAFRAAPVISSFALDSAAFAGPSNHDGDKKNPCPPPNQYGQNQTERVPNPGLNQYGQNQTERRAPNPGLNQYGQNQTEKPCGPPNQYGQNQTKISKYSRHG